VAYFAAPYLLARGALDSMSLIDVDLRRWGSSARSSGWPTASALLHNH
jgi:hypothetical protein